MQYDKKVQQALCFCLLHDLKIGCPVMKFARYLEETQIPEWQKAYIDYRGLKKQISVIQAARQEHQQQIIENAEKGERSRSRSASPPLSPPLSPQKLTFEEPPEIALRRMTRMSDTHPPPSILSRGGMSLRAIFPNLIAKSRPVSMVDSSMGLHAELLHSLSLHEIIPLLSPQEAAFFTMLDEQLVKVESFYCAREQEMIGRGRLLQTQLTELNDHRNRLLKCQTSWAANLKSGFKFPSSADAVSLESASSISPASPSTVNSFPAFVTALNFSPQDPIPSVAFAPSPPLLGKKRDTDEERPRGRSRDLLIRKPTSTGTNPLDADPESYLSARRKLKKAVLEHYRGLELLDNYRIMNGSGFRKILKKFVKVTKIPVQDQYMNEKVDRCAFASGIEVKGMMSQMQDMFAFAFLNQDKKKATTRLRTVTTPQTHHVCTFRAGLYLGLAVPALIDGLYKVSQNSTRNALPAWEVTLYLYGVFFLPLMFALLVGLNLAAWASARINYVFIFELDVLSRIDHRKYFEIPAFLLATLVYSFWFSVNRIGAAEPSIATLWLFIWFWFAVVVIVNPLPVMHRSSRYWFLRNLAKQFLAGTRKVEFTDFWLGDQLCSMTFTMSHLATFICAYVHRFQDGSLPTNLIVTCGTVTNMWGAELTLLCVPQVIRLIQSVRRYVDTPAFLHLVNAGKYATGIIYTGFYLKWRETNDRDAIFIFWILWGVFSSLYGYAWDLFMDWSLLSVRDKKYLFLRSELLYRNHISLYYFAMVTNFLARFSWIFYIPVGGPDMLTRTFIVAMIELIRRFQWNFFRLENEHLGNVDQYRVTREVPLPYPLGVVCRDDDEVEQERTLRAQAKSFRA